jgi:hypothetical protein
MSVPFDLEEEWFNQREHNLGIEDAAISRMTRPEDRRARSGPL